MNKKTIVLEYAKKHNYFTLSQVIKDTKLDKDLIQDYLSQFKQKKVVFAAGRDIYSVVKDTYKPVKESRVNTLNKILKKAFPFTEYIIWNTRQLQPLYHHTQQHHITFIETDKESIKSFFESISKKYRDTAIEKNSKTFYSSIDLSKNPIIIRKLISRSSKNTRIPVIEKILIDMFADLDKYKYISIEDYKELWKAICPVYRLNLGYIFNYGKRRKCFLKLYPYLIEIFNACGIGIRHLIEESGKLL